MSLPKRYILPLLLMTFAFLQPAAYADTTSAPSIGLNTVILKDATDVASAVADLSEQIKKQGFSIPLTVNHSAAASGAGLELPPNQVIFARPPLWLERRLLSQGKTIGIDLPFKFHIFEKNGEIALSTNTSGYLLDRHSLSTKDVILKIVNDISKQFGSDPNASGLITVNSTRSVESTVDALKKAILTNPDARIPLIINYGETIDLENGQFSHKSMPPILIVFGNAKVGTPLMQANPRIGIDLPLKFLVWESKEGVKITYNDPYFLAGRVDLQGMNARLTALSNALKNIVSAGAGG